MLPLFYFSKLLITITWCVFVVVGQGLLVELNLLV